MPLDGSTSVTNGGECPEKNILHELGHSLNDYRAAASGLEFKDNFGLFSMSTAPMENSANLTAAELYIEDDFILDQIHYEQYQRLVAYINPPCTAMKSGRKKSMVLPFTPAMSVQSWIRKSSTS